MDYVIAIGAGIAFGALCGLLKYLILWRPLHTGKRAMTAKTIYPTQIISLAVNAAVLLSVFFLRHLWPYPFEATIIAVAVSLSVASKLPHLKKAKDIKNISVDDQEQEQNDIK